MKIRHRIKNIVGDLLEVYFIHRAKRVEVMKYEDYRRKEIMRGRQLSNEEKNRLMISIK